MRNLDSQNYFGNQKCEPKNNEQWRNRKKGELKFNQKFYLFLIDLLLST